MKDTLVKLWNGNLVPIESFGVGNTKMEDLLRLSHRNQEKLLKTLNEEQTAVFERYVSLTEEYAARAAEQAFSDGFSLACRLLTEALTDEP